jgi:hypothetical protein
MSGPAFMSAGVSGRLDAGLRRESALGAGRVSGDESHGTIEKGSEGHGFGRACAGLAAGRRSVSVAVSGGPSEHYGKSLDRRGQQMSFRDREVAASRRPLAGRIRANSERKRWQANKEPCSQAGRRPSCSGSL